MENIQLTKCEAEVMDIIWQLNEATVPDVVEAMQRTLAYTTVMTTLRILEEKGVLKRGEKRGRAFTYKPVYTRKEVGFSMVNELSRRVFGGSLKNLVLTLIDGNEATSTEIQELKDAIAELDSQQSDSQKLDVT